MAILKGGLFGDISGKLNNVVFRKVNGKDVITVRPKKYQKTKSEKAIYVRSRFSVAVEFSKYLNSIPILKQVWKNAQIKGSSSFNKIEKFNISQVNDRAPSLKNIITPHDQSYSRICSFPFKDVSINLNEICGTIIDTDLFYPAIGAYQFTLVFVLLFYEPKEKGNKYFLLENTVYPNLDPITTNGEIKIPLNSIIKKEIALYSNLIIYSASVIWIDSRKEYFNSFTYVK